MDSFEVISHWLSKQHVVSYCVANAQDMWCANAFYLFCPHNVAFYLLSDTTTRHAQISGASSTVAGTVNGQPKTVALIRGVQFKGKLQLMKEEDSAALRKRYNQRFPVARVMSAPIWEIKVDELKFTDNTLGFGKKFYWQRTPLITE